MHDFYDPLIYLRTESYFTAIIVNKFEMVSLG